MLARLTYLLRTEFAALFSDTALVFGVRFTAAMVAYITQVVLARWMGAAELGVYVYALSWVWILTLIATLGMSSAASRFIPQSESDGDPGYARGYLRAGRRLAFGFGTVVALAATSTALIIGAGDVGFSMVPFVLAFVAIPFTALTNFHAGVARAYLWFLFAALTGTFIRPAMLLVAVIGARLAGVTLNATLVMSLLFAIVIGLALGQYTVVEKRLRRKFADVPPRSHTRHWLRIAVPIVLADAFVAYFIDVNVIVSGAFLSTEEIAIYNAALRTISVMVFALVAVGMATAPRAALLYTRGDTPGLQRLVARAAQLMFWPALMVLLGLVFVGKPLLGLFGPEFVAGYDAMLIAGSAQVLAAAGGPLLPLLKVTGHQDRCLVVFACVLVLVPVLYLLLVPRYGLAGGATAILLATVLWTVWLHALVVRHLGIRPSILSLREAF